MDTIFFPEVLKALKTEQFEWLESTFGGIQKAFEGGYLSEDHHSDAFDVFGSNFASVGRGCQAWLQHYPKSYVAHLAYAKWLSEKGFEARGESTVDGVSAKAWQGLHEHTDHAKEVLKSSVGLTALPLLSHVLVGRIEWVAGSEEELRIGQYPSWYRKALGIYPKSLSARRTYLQSLQPHWGGSEQHMLDYIQAPAQAAYKTQLMGSYHRFMGLYYASFEGDAQKSAQHFALTDQQTNTAWLHWYQARAAMALDERQQCLDHLWQAISINPNVVDFYVDLYDWLPSQDSDSANFTEGLMLLEKGVELGSLHLMYLRATLYRDGNFGQPKNYAKALEYGLQAFEEGHSGGGNVAAHILYGTDAQPNTAHLVNKPKGLALALESAKAGNRYSCNWVHTLYRKGEYPHLSPVEALDFLLQASYDGHAAATYWIAVQIAEGKVHHNDQTQTWHNGAAPDQRTLEQQTLEWYLCSAEMGDSDAMNQVAYIYRTGNQATPVNLQISAYWYQQAIDYGSTVPTVYSSLAYILGLSDDPELLDYPKAVHMYHKAIELWQSDNDGNLNHWWCNLAVILENSSNLEGAKAAYREAARLGDPDAKKRLQQLEGGFWKRLFGS